MFNLNDYRDFLFDTRCVGFFDPPITLKSGRPGHWYVNMRSALNSQASKRMLARFVYDFAGDLELQTGTFLGVPEGATPLGEACNDLIDYKDPSAVPAIVLRGGKKVHGDPLNRYSVGEIRPGIHVVLVEDVSTTGGSSMEYILRLQEIGVVIDHVISCVSRFERRDRGRTVADVLERDYHVRWTPMIDARDLLPEAVRRLNPSEGLVRDIEAYYEKYGVEPIELPRAA